MAKYNKDDKKVDPETLFDNLMKKYIERCYYLSDCMDNYLNPFLGMYEEDMFIAGALELIKSGRHVEAKVIFRLIIADISLTDLFKQLQGSLNRLPSEKDLAEFLAKKDSSVPPNIKVPF